MRNVLEQAMGMSDAVWDRHTNPWSGWSRLAIPILFAIAIWSRGWFGGWSLFLIAMVAVFTWWNPRAFRPPMSVDNWMSRAILGERIWLDRKRGELPSHHRNVPMMITGVSGAGLLPLAWGLWQFDFWATLAGLILIIGGKLWFLDRMVWLRRDIRSANGA